MNNFLLVLNRDSHTPHPLSRKNVTNDAGDATTSLQKYS